MDYAEVLQSSFLDELEKISFAKGKFLRGALSSRKGRRPMRVATMLKKEKGGELFKYTKQAVDLKGALTGLEASLNEHKELDKKERAVISAMKASLSRRKTAGEGSVGNVVPYSDTDYQSSTGASGPTGKPAQIPKGPNDQPSREDGRENAHTAIPAFARFSLAPAAVNTPEEHGTL